MREVLLVEALMEGLEMVGEDMEVAVAEVEGLGVGAEVVSEVAGKESHSRRSGRRSGRTHGKIVLCPQRKMMPIFTAFPMQFIPTEPHTQMAHNAVHTPAKLPAHNFQFQVHDAPNRA